MKSRNEISYLVDNLFLVLINVVALTFGISLIFTDVWIRVHGDSFIVFLNSFLYNNYKTIDYDIGPLLVIDNLGECIWFIPTTIGSSFVLLTGVCLYGLCAHSKRHLDTYASCVVVINRLFVCSICVQLAVYLLFRETILEGTSDFFKSHYRFNKTISFMFMNALMLELECCGIKNYTDFKETIIPIHCCKFDVQNRVTYNIRSLECIHSPSLEISNFNRGCFEGVEEHFRVHWPLYLLNVVIFHRILCYVITWSRCISRSYGFAPSTHQNWIIRSKWQILSKHDGVARKTLVRTALLGHAKPNYIQTVDMARKYRLKKKLDLKEPSRRDLSTCRNIVKISLWQRKSASMDNFQSAKHRETHCTRLKSGVPQGYQQGLQNANNALFDDL